MYVEVGIFVSSCSLMRPTWHPLSAVRPSPPQFLLPFPFFFQLDHSPLSTPHHSHSWAHRAASLLWSGSIGLLLLPYSPRFAPLHRLLTPYFTFPHLPLTHRGHGRPQLRAKSEPCFYHREVPPSHPANFLASPGYLGDWSYLWLICHPHRPKQ